MCFVHKSQLDDLAFDIAQHSRRQADQRALIDHISALPLDKDRKAASSTAGLLLEQNPLFDIAFDPYKQIPHDPYHQFVAGLGKRVLNVLLVSLKSTGLQSLTDRLRAFPLYNNWPSFRRFEDLASWTLDDVKHFLLIAPLVLRGFFAPAVLTQTAATYFSETLKKSRAMRAVSERAICDSLTQLFRELADCLACIYCPVARVDLVNSSVSCFGRTATSVLGDLVKVPNFHNMVHQAASIQTFGSARNYDVAAKERRCVTL